MELLNSFCVGPGLTGSPVFHRLRAREKGGAEQVHLNHGKLLYGNGSKSTCGCTKCLMPKEFCPRCCKRLHGGMSGIRLSGNADMTGSFSTTSSLGFGNAAKIGSKKRLHVQRKRATLVGSLDLPLRMR